jgi:hypothetical protein
MKVLLLNGLHLNVFSRESAIQKCAQRAKSTSSGLYPLTFTCNLKIKLIHIQSTQNRSFDR